MIKNKIEAEALLTIAIDIGCEMLISGAEISRVEDSINRICKAYGANRVDVFAIIHFVSVDIYFKEFGHITQSRRIQEFKYDLDKLEYLNELSRNICSSNMELSEVRGKIDSIKEAVKEASFGRIALGYIMISSAFTIFFGGSYLDAIISGIIGFLILPIERKMLKGFNKFLDLFMCSFLVGLIVVIANHFIPTLHTDKISIGIIMVLIPGLMITNSFREMFSYNILSGIVRLAESILISMAIAVGIMFSNILFLKILAVI